MHLEISTLLNETNFIIMLLSMHIDSWFFSEYKGKHNETRDHIIDHAVRIHLKFLWFGKRLEIY